MPELNPQYAQFKKEIEQMLAELVRTLERGKPTQIQLAQIAAEIDFFEQLKGLGYEQTVDKYLGSYETVLSDLLVTARKQGVDFAGINLGQLELIKELDKKYLLGKASTWGAQFDSEFVKSVIRGDTIKQTVANLSEIPLTDSQLGTVMNTSYSEFSRMGTKEIFKNEPEQRFSYFGPLIQTSSEQCSWLVPNQNPDGYTSAQIEAGIDTPAGIVNWSGRDPNWNCNHNWRAIITEL